jgi:hypothetical protein
MRLLILVTMPPSWRQMLITADPSDPSMPLDHRGDQDEATADFKIIHDGPPRSAWYGPEMAKASALLTRSSQSSSASQLDLMRVDHGFSPT